MPDTFGRLVASSVVELFEERADADPARAAIRILADALCPAREVSYATLDAEANAIAASLIDRGVGQGSAAALLITDPELALAAQLGVLRAGGAYVPVNPGQPRERTRRMLAELGDPIALADAGGAAAAPAGAVAVEDLVAEPGVRRPAVQVEGAAPAYVLYTSGSTGCPRGVVQSRVDMAHNVLRHAPLEIDGDDVVSLLSADGFVGSVSNPWIALAAGATLAPCSFRDLGAGALVPWCEAAGVTVLYAFPSFVRHAIGERREDASGEATRLRLAYLGGEPVRRTDLASIRKAFPAAVVAVGLNSTETGLTCLHLVSPGSRLPDPVPVGRAARDVTVRVVDHHGDEVPDGQAGEIVVDGPYINPSRWRKGAMRRADGFWTGDRGRAEAGSVFHLGRRDGMVKIRGFRVEIAEVEAAVAELDGVVEVAVVAGERDDETELTAHVVASNSSIDAVVVRRWVGQRLPAAMVPRDVVLAPELPRTANGKVDRRALIAGAPVAHAASVTLAPPALALRAAVEARWREVLPGGEIDDEDFFALGGTSISAVAVVSRLRRDFGVALPLATIFETPTAAAMASAIEALLAAQPSAPRRSTATVRPARRTDFDAVCALVNHYITTSAVNFHEAPQQPAEWIAAWSDGNDRYPWLVAVDDHEVVGIAYAQPWKRRAAYQWSVEVTVYVAPSAVSRGVGRALYERLVVDLEHRGYRMAFAVIALPNPASERLHRACGFTVAGTLTRAGYKHGAWRDVAIWQRSIGTETGAPEGPPNAEPRS
jgi:acyl-coenzyme A synthetase/AMP-(fatty) acid ligase/L-amino acid N-acyltransferase YncA/acyl carrier protein